MVNNTESIENTQKNFMAVSSLLEEQDGEFNFQNLTPEQDHSFGQGMYRLAKLYYDKADLIASQSYFEQALEKTIYPKDAFAMLKIYGFLIRIHSQNLNESKASEYIDLAQELVEKFSKDLPSLGAEFFYNVGMIYTYKSDFGQALTNFTLSYQKAQEENEPELISKALYSMANALYHQGMYKESLTFLDQLADLLDILNKGYLKGSMHVLKGHVFKDIAQYDKAIEHYDLGINILSMKNCWNLYGSILLGKGVTYKKMGEFDKAMTFFKMGLNSISHDFKRLRKRYEEQVADVNDSSVDLFLDRHNKIIHEQTLGTIDFKHRFVLLEILFLLAKSPGKAYDKDDLSNLIWKEEYNPLIHDKLIYTSISRLRKLIEPKGTGRKYILRSKDGYTFNPRVKSRFHKEEGVSTKKIIGHIEINTPV